MTTSVRFGSAVLLLLAGTGFLALAGRSGVETPALADGAGSVQVTNPAIVRGQALLARATRASAAGRLVAPAGDNAVELYLAARQQLPGNIAARDALGDLEPQLVKAARTALNQGENDEARRILALLEQAAPGSYEAHALRSELEGLRAAIPVAASAKGAPHTRGGGAVGRSPAAL